MDARLSQVMRRQSVGETLNNSRQWVGFISICRRVLALTHIPSL
jgi:hypothetical protein